MLSSVRIDITIPYEAGEDQKKAVFALVTKVVPEMSEASYENFDLKVVTGGLSNILFVAITPKLSVIVRLYGLETERIIDRSSERFFQSLFLKTYGQGVNGLVYEYLDGYKNIEYDDLARLTHYKAIAKRLAEFHFTATSRSMCVLPFSGESLFCTYIHTEWLKTCCGVRGNIKPEKVAVYDGLNIVDKISKEAAWLEAEIQKYSADLSVVICHNDLLAGNVMVRAADNDVRLIDFEYGRRNYALYDIANHFNEYAGFDCHWDLYPNQEHQEAFLREYFTWFGRECGVPYEGLGIQSLDRMYRLVQLLTLSSHMCWGLWAVIQEAFSTIDFDYLSYSVRRFDRYWADKPRVVALLDGLK